MCSTKKNANSATITILLYQKKLDQHFPDDMSEEMKEDILRHLKHAKNTNISRLGEIMNKKYHTIQSDRCFILLIHSLMNL
jgi:hypothetical protein